MKSVELLKELRNYPLFSENDLAKILQKKAEHVKTLLYRLRKQKLVFRVERGKYSAHDDPLIFSSYLYQPSYISLWTALRFYNLTEQLPRTVFVMVPKPKKAIRFMDRDIVFAKTKHFWGYQKERYDGFEIFMADREKAVIDCLISNKIPLDEVVKAIENTGLDVDKLVGYVLKIGGASLAKRAGYLLEESGYDSNPLLSLVDYNYVPLDPSLGKTGKKNKKWRLTI
jgi:predicted transcriptional regulator of viral defense system